MDSKVTGGDYVGGVAGYSGTAIGRIENCHFIGIGHTVGGGIYVGGIAGRINNSMVTGCTNSSAVSYSGSDDSVGGIVGQNNNGTVSNCTNTGTPETQVGTGNAAQ